MNLIEFVNEMYEYKLSAEEIDLRVQQLLLNKIDMSIPFVGLEMNRLDVLLHLMAGPCTPNMYGENSSFYINGLYSSNQVFPKHRLYYIKKSSLLDIAKISAQLRERDIQYSMYHPGNFGEILGNATSYEQPGIVDKDGNPISSDDDRYIQLTTDISFINGSILDLVAKKPEFMYEISPRQFEELIAELLEKNGYKVDLTPISNDGGVDIYASQKSDLGSFLYLVQCKRNAPKNKVGIEVVTNLYGVLQKNRATAGLVVTSSFYTRGAKKFQSEVEHQMSLWDYTALVENIRHAIGKS
jgi:hypothetical protein